MISRILSNRRIRRNRVLEIKVLGEVDGAVTLIRTHPKVKSAECNGSAILVEFSGDDKSVANLLEQLMSNGMRIQSFAEKDPTLEDVFMMVTKGLVT